MERRAIFLLLSINPIKHHIAFAFVVTMLTARSNHQESSLEHVLTLQVAHGLCNYNRPNAIWIGLKLWDFGSSNHRSDT